MSEFAVDEAFSTRLEVIAAEPAFDDLLNLAVETCLTDPSSFDKCQYVLGRETRDTTVPNLGLWAARAALDLSNNDNAFFSPSDDSPEAVPHSQLLCIPDYMGTTPDIKIQSKIEAFGQAILDEAFYCLGADAFDQVIKFKNATSDQEKHEVIGWLLQRIVDIQDKKHDSSDDELTIDEVEAATGVRLSPEEGQGLNHDDPITRQDLRQFYHPGRLSPRLMGRFPETQTRPTCLGISILAASFFEKAEVPYLHAGVMMTASESGQLNLASSIYGFADAAKLNDITLPDPVADKLWQIKSRLRANFDMNRGHHAAVLFQFAPGSWAQIDPNYGSNCILHDIDSAALQTEYEKLVDVSAIYPGVETSFGICEGRVSNYGWSDIMNLSDICWDKDMLAVALFSLGTSENPLDNLKTYLLNILSNFKAEPEDDEKSNFEHLLEDYYLRPAEIGKTKYVDEVLEHNIFTYIFPDAVNGDLTKSLKRCISDPAYLERRVEDLALAPLFLAYRIFTDIVNNLHNVDFPAAGVELGMPKYRIGACVLSDFAVYCGDDLPVSFWQTYWPSHIVLADHLPENGASKADAKNAVKLAGVIKNSSLRYFNSYGIVSKFLEQGENKEDDQSTVGKAG